MEGEREGGYLLVSGSLLLKVSSSISSVSVIGRVAQVSFVIVVGLFAFVVNNFNLLKHLQIEMEMS